MIRLLSTLALCLLVHTAFGATYYVDYVGGSDAANGTSTGTAWQHYPSDVNATGVADAATLVAGDTIIFKGGVSYVATANVPLNWSGSAGNVITYDGNSAGTFGSGKAILTTNNVEVDGFFYATAARNYLTFKNFHFYNIGGYSEGNAVWTTSTDITADHTTNTFAKVGGGAHGYVVGNTLNFKTTGTYPAGLAEEHGSNDPYYVRSVPTANTFTLSTTSSGAELDITTNGTGTLTAWRPVIAPPDGGGIGFNAGGSNIRIQDCKFEEIGQWQTVLPMSGTLSMTGTGIFLQRVTQGVIDNCEFTKMKNGIGLKVNAGGTIGPITVSDCSFHTNLVWGMDIAPRAVGTTLTGIVVEGCDFYNYSQCDSGNWTGFGEKPHRDGIFLRTANISCTWNETIIRGNRFWDDSPGASAGGTACVYVSQGPTVSIYNNIFLTDPMADGVVSVGGANATTNNQHVLIANNTFAGPGRVRVSSSSNANSVTIKNNILYRTTASTSSSALLVENPANLGSLVCDYNLYFANQSLSGWSAVNNGSGKTFAQWKALGYETNGLLADPMVQSMSGASSTWNLSLESSSPAIGEGADLSSKFTTDYDGAPRTAPWDIGAYAFGATYYIDYATGSDANSGTSTASPWKLCPGMPSFAGTYTHVAGDRFIFKGGVTWPNAALGLVIENSGSSAANRDYYGVDQTWYTGGAWSRPTFDAGGVALPSPVASRGSAIRINGDYVQIDNLRIVGVYVNAQTTFYNCSILPYQSEGYLITNCYLGDWVLAPGSEGAHETSFGGVYPFSSTGRMESCTVRGPLLTGNKTSGGGADGVTEVINCDISQVTQGIFNAQLAHGNVIHKIGQSHKAGAHGNAQTIYGSGTVYGNIYYDIPHGVCVHLVPGWDGDDGTILFYNNIAYDSVPVPLQISESGNDGGTTTVRIFNNIVRNSGYAVYESDRVNPEIAVIDIRNNLFITDDADGIFLAPDNPNVTISNNHVMTLAAATEDGLVDSNLFIGSRGYDPLVGEGVTLSAYFTTDFLGVTRTVPWTIGAYANVSGSTSPVFTLNPVSQSVVAGVDIQFTAAATNSPTWQWYKNASPISGATLPTLTYNDVTSDNNGTYYVVATNGVGSTTSASATLVVGTPPAIPVITTQPISQSVNAGTDATFTAAASGTPTLAWQWYKNNAAMNGQISPLLFLPSVTDADAASYKAVVTNPAGSATTSTVTLTVTAAPTKPVITTSPTSRTAAVATSTTFTAAATGVPTPTWTWYFNGTLIPGKTASTLTLASVIPDNAGSYSARATNSMGVANTSSATLTVTVPPPEPTQPLKAPTLQSIK